MQYSSARSWCGSSAAGLPNLTLNGRMRLRYISWDYAESAHQFQQKPCHLVVLCKHLDDMLTYYGASASVSLTDLLLMTGEPAPTPGFHMLVQYVATLCQLHSVPKVQFQLKLHNQQTLDTSQAHVLAHGHKSLVLQLGNVRCSLQGALFSCWCVYL